MKEKQRSDLPVSGRHGSPDDYPATPAETLEHEAQRLAERRVESGGKVDAHTDRQLQRELEAATRRLTGSNTSDPLADE